MPAGSTPRLRPIPLAISAASAAVLYVIAISGGSYDLVNRQTGGLLLWWGVAVSAIVVRPRPRLPRGTGLAVTAFAAAIALWIAFNLENSVSTERSVDELARAVTHLAPIVLLGWVMPTRHWSAALTGLLIAAVVITAVALGDRLSPGFAGQAQSIVPSAGATRLATPFGYWNGVGAWSVMTVLLLLAASAHSIRWWVRSLSLAAVPIATTAAYLTYSRSALGGVAIGLMILVALSRNRWTVAVHILAAAIVTAVTVDAVRNAPAIADGTGTAGAGQVLLAVVVVALVLAATGAGSGLLGLDRLRLPRRPAQFVALISVALFIAASGVTIATYGQRAWGQFNTSEQVAASAIDPTARLTSLNGTRLDQWKGALDGWTDHRWRGTGAGTVEFTINQHSDNAEFVRDAHNAFVEALAEQGIPGLALLVGLLLAIAAAVATALRSNVDVFERGLIAGSAAGLAAFAFGTTVDWFWELTALAMFAMALVGLLISAGKRDRRRIPAAMGNEPVDDHEAPVPAEPPAARRPVWLRPAIVALAVVAIVVELPGLVGTSEIRRSSARVASGDIAGARARADEAINVLPWASSPYLQRALVDEQSGAWNAARRGIRLAMARDPQNWRLPLVASRIEAKAGRPEAAIAEYRKAKALRPQGAFFN